MKTYDALGRLKVAGGVTLEDSANIDAFGRLRVSNPVGLFDSQFQYDPNPLLWESTTVGGGAVAHNSNGYVTLTTTGVKNDEALRQSRQYIRYQPGRSQLVLLTFNLTATGTNVQSYIGYGDASNGVFLRISNTSPTFIRRNGGSDTEVAQTSWNVDKFDGTGPSGVTLDITKSQIFWADLEWLGVGRVRCGFVVDGQLYPAHEFVYANSGTLTYMQTANLPIRYQISNTGAGAAGSLTQICSAVFSEGGFETDRGYPFGFGNSTTGVSVTTRRAILSIRPKATFNSIVNRGTILPEFMDLTLSSAASQTVFWELVYNPTYTGTPTWTSADANSIVEYSVHADAAAGAITGGTRIKCGYAPSADSGRISLEKEIVSRLPLCLDVAGANPRALAIVCTATGATTCYGALNWRELR